MPAVLLDQCILPCFRPPDVDAPRRGATETQLYDALDGRYRSLGDGAIGP